MEGTGFQATILGNVTTKTSQVNGRDLDVISEDLPEMTASL